MIEFEGRVREAVPFRLRTADGRRVEFEYSSPRPAEAHDERALLRTLPWFEPGKPLRLRYALYVHAGIPPLEALQNRWEAFAHTDFVDFGRK